MTNCPSTPKPFRADGGDISTSRLEEIANNPYGDEEKCWLAKRVLASLSAGKEQESVRWGAPKTVKQLIGQLQTLDPDLETTALLRMPADFRDGNAVRQVPLSISYERMDGQWLAPYKSDHRKVLAFWAKPDDRNTAERGEELYTAPPAPVSVPDESAVELLATDLMKRIDKITGERHSVATLSSLRISIVEACRAAMLQGAEPVTTAYKLPEETGSSLQLRNLIRQRHAEWSQATFGDVGPVGPLKHLSKEALEAAAEPEDLSEWADMQFLLWDAQRRADISDGDITAAMEEKLKVNMARQWPEPKEGEPRQHIKPAPQQEEKQCT